MKTKSFLLFAVAVVSVVISSCSKKSAQDILLTQNISAKISMNETYTFTLPDDVSTNDFRITNPGLHGSVSAIQKDVAGTLTYIYTPQSGFTGEDHIVLSTLNSTEEDDDNDSHSCGQNENENDQDEDSNNDNDNEDSDEHHEHQHGEHHDKHKEADKNMVINISLTISAISNTRL